mgnify:FL=1
MGITIEQAQNAVWTFAGKATNGYSVFEPYGTDRYIGFVRKAFNGGKGWNAWRHGVPVNDANGTEMITFRTRREAAEALAPIAAVERLAQTHWDNATSEDRARSAGDSPVYVASRQALVSAVAAQYPDLDPQEVYHQWTEHGQTILQCVNFDRAERIARIRREAEDVAEEHKFHTSTEGVACAPNCPLYTPETAAEEAVSGAQTQAPVASPESFEAPKERDVTLDINGDGLAGYTVTLIAVFPEARVADGYTRNGTPFARTTVRYADLAAARRMVDVIVAEFRSDTSRVWAAFTVTLTGLASLSSRLSPEVRVREGGSFRAAVVASAPPVAAKVPAYRAAGFPSLDAAIGAWHGGHA